MYTNIIHNDDICNYFLKNQQFIFKSLGNCRECRLKARWYLSLQLIIPHHSSAARLIRLTLLIREVKLHKSIVVELLCHRL